MTNTIRARRAFAALLATVVAAGCHPAATNLHVPLEYRPTGSLATGTISGNLAGGPPLAVTVTDSRTDGEVVGKNVEKEGAGIPVYADGRPDQFVRDAVSRELGNVGVSIASDPAQAKRVLHFDLRRFWTEESSLYNGMVTANAELKTASGKVLWQGLATGASKRFGRSLSAENYQEAFSEATLDMVGNLLKNGDFVAALHAPEPSAATAQGKSRKAHR